MSSTQKTKSSVYFVSLGCPKNLVDSQVMLGMLEKDRYTISNDSGRRRSHHRQHLLVHPGLQGRVDRDDSRHGPAQAGRQMQSARRLRLPPAALLQGARERDARSRSLHRHRPIPPHHRASRCARQGRRNGRAPSEALLHRPARFHSHRKRSAHAHRARRTRAS